MTKVSRKEVYEAIDSERDYQDAMWGETLSSERAPTEDMDGGFRTLDEFSLYISGYADDLTHFSSHYTGAEQQLAIIRKIAGLAVACMEQHGAPKREMPKKLRDRHAA